LHTYVYYNKGAKMKNFYKNIISESQSTVLSRLMLAIIVILGFFIPYFIGITNFILNDESKNNLLAIIFMNGITWLIIILCTCFVYFLLFFLIKCICWIFTGNFYVDIDFSTKFIALIISPFIFIFNFVFCKNDSKTLLIKNIFKKRNEKAKELLNS